MPELEEKLSYLVDCPVQIFDVEIFNLGSEALIQLVDLLQECMTAEESAFQLLRRKVSYSPEDRGTRKALVESQTRLANLCERNVKVFQVQTIEAAKYDETISSDESSSLLMPERKSLSSQYRDARPSAQPNPAAVENAFNSVLSDILKKDFKLRPTSERMSSDSEKVEKSLELDTPPAAEGSQNFEIKCREETRMSEIQTLEHRDIASPTEPPPPLPPASPSGDDDHETGNIGNPYPVPRFTENVTMDASDRSSSSESPRGTESIHAALVDDLLKASPRIAESESRSRSRDRVYPAVVRTPDQTESRRRVMDSVKRERKKSLERAKSGERSRSPTPLKSILKKPSPPPDADADRKPSFPSLENFSAPQGEPDRGIENQPPVMAKLDEVQSQLAAPQDIKRAATPDEGVVSKPVLDSNLVPQSPKRQLSPNSKADDGCEPILKVQSKTPSVDRFFASPTPSMQSGMYTPSVLAVSKEFDECRDWDPRPLLESLYRVDYWPKRERKEVKFNNLEGWAEHLPVGTRVAIAEHLWKKKYFRTSEGYLELYQSDESSAPLVGSVRLSGSEIILGPEKGVVKVISGKDSETIVLRAPQNDQEWRLALMSHAALSGPETYVVPAPVSDANPVKDTVIIELGSCSIRAGRLSAEPSLPELFFPTVASYMPDGTTHIGIDAFAPSHRHDGELVFPISNHQGSLNRYVIDVRTVEKIFEKVFHDLNVKSSSAKVLLSLPHNTPTSQTAELIRRLVRGRLSVRGVALAYQPTLALYSYDDTTGVVVDLGERLSIVPFVDGYLVNAGVISLPLGGDKVAESLRRDLPNNNDVVYPFLSQVERYILRYLTEQSSYVAPSFEAEREKYDYAPNEIDMTVDLKPFGLEPGMIEDFRLGAGRFAAPEGLLRPKRWGLEFKGLPHLVYAAVQHSPIDSRRPLFRKIYLSGGASQIPGLAQRLENDLAKLVPSTIQVQVHMSPYRYHAAYVGAQILAGSTQIDRAMVGSTGLEEFLAQLHMHQSC